METFDTATVAVQLRALLVPAADDYEKAFIMRHGARLQEAYNAHAHGDTIRERNWSGGAAWDRETRAIIAEELS